MCNLFTIGKDGHTVAKKFGLKIAPGLSGRRDLAPTDQVLVVRSGAAGERLAHWQRWGLIPPWAKLEMAAKPLTNARVETLAVRPAFRDALRQRRCLVPADGFYEWSTPVGGGRKRRHLIRREDGELFAFAGLWETWLVPEFPEEFSPSRSAPAAQLAFEVYAAPQPSSPPPGDGALVPGQTIESCTIVTTAAAPWLAPLHHRMPVVLPPECYDDWLRPDGEDSSGWEHLLRQTPDQGWVIEGFTV